jgi:hypothetical protein
LRAEEDDQAQQPEREDGKPEALEEEASDALF